MVASISAGLTRSAISRRLAFSVMTANQERLLSAVSGHAPLLANQRRPRFRHVSEEVTCVFGALSAASLWCSIELVKTVMRNIDKSK